MKLLNVKTEIEFTKIVDIVLNQKLFVSILTVSISVITVLYLNMKTPTYDTTVNVYLPDSKYQSEAGKRLAAQLSHLYDCSVEPIKTNSDFRTYEGLIKITISNTSLELSKINMAKIIEHVKRYNARVESDRNIKLDDINHYQVVIGDIKSQVHNTNRKKIIFVITSFIIGLVLSILILVLRQFIAKNK